MRIFRSGWTLAILALLFVLLGLFGGPSSHWEIAVNSAFLHYRMDHPGTTRLVVAVTQFGSAYVTLGLGLVAVLILLLRGARDRALLLAAGIAAARLADDGLKLLFDRPRPRFDLPEVAVSSSSYPSGHSGNSMAIYLMIALALAAPRHRAAAVGLAAAVAIVVGLTRPFLGVHWPTDVLGGWVLGLLSAWLFLAVGARSGALPIEPQHQIVGRHGPALDEAEALS